MALNAAPGWSNLVKEIKQLGYVATGLQNRHKPPWCVYSLGLHLSFFHSGEVLGGENPPLEETLETTHVWTYINIYNKYYLHNRREHWCRSCSKTCQDSFIRHLTPHKEEKLHAEQKFLWEVAEHYVIRNSGIMSRMSLENWVFLHSPFDWPRDLMWLD